MKFSEIKKMWAEDSEIDVNKLDTETLITPKLMSKYMTLLSTESYKLKQLYQKQKELKIYLEDYYMKLCPQEEYQKKPWPLVSDRKLSLRETSRAMDQDQDWIEMYETINALEEKVKFLETCVKSLPNRRWEIANYINWQKIKNGVV